MCVRLKCLPCVCRYSQHSGRGGYLPLLLISVAAVSCFCYRGQSQSKGGKKIRSPGSHIGSESRPLAFPRKPIAVKSPNQQQLTYSHPIGGSSVAISHHLKKSPSPTGAKTPPGSCPIGKTPSPLSGNSLVFLVFWDISNNGECYCSHDAVDVDTNLRGE